MARIEHESGRGLQAVVDLGAVADLSDGELLERFVAGREEVVFAALVGRHGPMVWGVCRRILRDHHEAEDAFQAAFLVLARRAGAVAPRDRVGPWLHGVARRTALKARGLQTRRRAREVASPAPPDRAAALEPPDDRLALLDREVARLPARYRDPIILCELEGKSYRAAADQLGWPIGTVSGRLARARAILADRLGRAGRGDGAVPLVAVPRILAPAHLAGPIARAAPLVAAGQEVAAGVVPAGSITLMRGVLTTMLLSRIKVAALLVAGSALTVGGGLAYHAVAAPSTPPPPPEQRPAATPPVAQAPAAQTTDPTASYTYSIEPDAVSFDDHLAIDYGKFRLRGERVSILPMMTTQGTAGAMLIGDLEFVYAPEPGQEFKGRASGAMLRFNPGESAAILKPEGQTRIKMRNQGMAELSRQLLRSAVNRCWHRGQEVLLPPRGAFAAVVYAEEPGELLISFDERTATVHNFTTRKGWYDKK